MDKRKKNTFFTISNTLCRKAFRICRSKEKAKINIGPKVSEHIQLNLAHLRWRVSKLIFARVENKLFLVWRSEEPDGCQLPFKLMGYMKGVGLPSFVFRRPLRERGSPRIVSNRRCTMLAKLNTYTDYFILQQVLIIDG